VGSPGEQGLGGGRLHHPAEIHDDHPVGEVLDHAEIVADEEVGEAEFLPEVHEEVQDLGLDRDVEGGYRLVADEKARLHGECSGDADALSLAARELVRKARLEGGIEADPLQHLVHIATDLAPRYQAVDERCLAHDLGHPHPGIERGHRVLEDHLHLELGVPGILALEARKVAALIAERAVGGLEDPCHDPPDRGLATAGFADQAHHLARLDGEIDAVDGVHHFLGVVAAHEIDELFRQVELAHEPLADPVELDDRRRHETAASGSVGCG
jgi:hypothetical protein